MQEKRRVGRRKQTDALQSYFETMQRKKLSWSPNDCCCRPISLLYICTPPHTLPHTHKHVKTPSLPTRLRVCSYLCCTWATQMCFPRTVNLLSEPLPQPGEQGQSRTRRCRKHRLIMRKEVFLTEGAKDQNATNKSGTKEVKAANMTLQTKSLGETLSIVVTQQRRGCR